MLNNKLIGLNPGFNGLNPGFFGLQGGACFRKIPTREMNREIRLKSNLI